MKKLFSVGCLLTAAMVMVMAMTAPPVHAQTDKAAPINCANASTQTQLNQCAYEDFLAANAGYAASYKKMADKLGSQQKDQLRRAQKLWIQYRTAACNFESSGVAGGSAQAMVKSQCDARMTRARTAELELLANCKEGDLSCPRFGK